MRNLQNPRRFILLLLLLGATAAAMALTQSGDHSYWQDPVDQWASIKFSHKLHVMENELECADCHAMADSSQLSSDLLFPKKADCAMCHEVEEEESCVSCHVEGTERLAYAAPERELIFSHAAHSSDDLTCASCHAGVEIAEKPSLASLPTMASCQSCHDGIKQDDTCETCHNAVQTIAPVNHRHPEWVREHRRLAAIDAFGAGNDCAACHQESFCADCHAGASLQFTSEGPFRSVAPLRSGLFRSSLLLNQGVHEPNYRFTHAIDHKAKSSDCLVCHTNQQFCADCHQQNQDSGFRSPLPASHTSPDFVRIGVGSGGGIHADLARKDIENCAACHDLEGNDPACLLCHTDRTPGLGNDPKTHQDGFRMSNRDYTEPGANCFQCHIDTKQAGVGFCGYCHGMK